MMHKNVLAQKMWQLAIIRKHILLTQILWPWACSLMSNPQIPHDAIVISLIRRSSLWWYGRACIIAGGTDDQHALRTLK